MANPQIEDGHIDIANEIAEALMRINLSAYESRALWCIFRKTYGWKKKEDWLSLSQFREYINLDRRLIHRALKSLESKNIIVINRDDRERPKYGFQKDYTQWKLSSKKMTVINRDDALSSKEMIQLSSKEIPTKETITKETITKEIYYRSNDFDRFWSCYPKKIGKQAALRAFKAHSKRIPPITQLISIIERQKQTDQWKRGYITNPATWINQGRWEDDIESMNGGNSNGHDGTRNFGRSTGKVNGETQGTAQSDGADYPIDCICTE